MDFSSHSKRAALGLSLLLSMALTACGEPLIDKTVDQREISDVKLGKVLQGSTTKIRDVKFSPNGKLIAASDDDGFAYLWDFQSGARLAKIEGHTEFIRSVEFSSDSQKVLTCSDDDSIIVSDISGTELLEIEMQESCNGAQFAKDDTAIIASIGRNQMREFDMTGDVKRRWRTFGGGGFSFSPDGTLYATVSAPLRRPGNPPRYAAEQKINIFDLEQERDIRALTTKFDRFADTVGFSHDSKIVVSSYPNEYASKHVVFNARSQKVYSEFDIEDAYTYSANLSPDNQYVVVGSFDSKVRVIDTLKGTKLFELEHPGEVLVFDAVFSPNGNNIISSASDGKIHIWDVEYKI